MPDYEQENFPLGEEVPDKEKTLLTELFKDTSADTTLDQIHALEDALGVKEGEYDSDQAPEAYRDALSVRFLNEHFEDEEN